MASRGRKRTEIAQDLRVHRSTVILWLKRYHKRGLAGLQIQWAPGKTRRIPETLAPTIQEWVKKGPQRCGLDRANWTYEELATYLYQQTGIDVKRSAMQDFCQHHQIRPYRPTYRYLIHTPDNFVTFCSRCSLAFPVYPPEFRDRKKARHRPVHVSDEETYTMSDNLRR
jgi:transposase